MQFFNGCKIISYRDGIGSRDSWMENNYRWAWKSSSFEIMCNYTGKLTSRDPRTHVKRVSHQLAPSVVWIPAHERFKGEKIQTFIKLVVAIFGSCCIYRQWKQTDYYARSPTDWLSAGINISVLISGLCGTISLHFGEQSIPLYQTYQAFIAFNFIGCIAVSLSKSGVLRTGRTFDWDQSWIIFRLWFWFYWFFVQLHAVLKWDSVTRKSFVLLSFPYLVSHRPRKTFKKLNFSCLGWSCTQHSDSHSWMGICFWSNFRSFETDRMELKVKK